jgi:hypothetical protein
MDNAIPVFGELTNSEAAPLFHLSPFFQLQQYQFWTSGDLTERDSALLRFLCEREKRVEARREPDELHIHE